MMLRSPRLRAYLRWYRLDGKLACLNAFGLGYTAHVGLRPVNACEPKSGHYLTSAIFFKIIVYDGSISGSGACARTLDNTPCACDPASLLFPCSFVRAFLAHPFTDLEAVWAPIRARKSAQPPHFLQESLWSHSFCKSKPTAVVQLLTVALSSIWR